ncbi:Plasmodium exported protein, unknown function [Plasmodium vivax]|uniref:Variable surface protein n=1 Tax=Plasmodium vivax TaxID=5855 RepID=A0A564ZNZ6_PLAVI|nr:Plasmodium exported protein, unknown function [Plasmodium vivax]
MDVWGNYNIKDSVNLLVLLKLLAYILLIWIWYPNKDMYGFGNALKNQDEQNKNLYTNFNRLLAKHEAQWELERRNYRDNLSDHSNERRKKYINEDISSYSQLKKKGLNDFDLYMRNYKHRYAKKKGFSKLDCYCEKKLFDNIQRLYGIGEKLRNEKKSFKNYILKKYGICYILIALIPALSLIYFILFGAGSWGHGFLKHCDVKEHWTKSTNRAHLNNSSTADCEKMWLYKYRDLIKNLRGYLITFSFIMAIIFLIVVIYVLIKVIKYERLKSGKGMFRF